MALVVSAGCGGTRAYIYKWDEFNRENPDFNKQLADRDSVTFCYNAYATTPEELSDLALVECGKYGKTARLVSRAYDTCPLLTPISAQFSCVRSSEE